MKIYPYFSLYFIVCLRDNRCLYPILGKRHPGGDSGRVLKSPGGYKGLKVLPPHGAWIIEASKDDDILLLLGRISVLSSSNPN